MQVCDSVLIRLRFRRYLDVIQERDGIARPNILLFRKYIVEHIVLCLVGEINM